MKIILFIAFILITSCSQNKNKSNFEYNQNMSFDEFKIKLEEYAKNNPYPNIND